MIDHTGKYSAGNLVFNKKGSKHAVKAGPRGYEILVFYRGKSDANRHLLPGDSKDSSGN